MIMMYSKTTTLATIFWHKCIFLSKGLINLFACSPQITLVTNYDQQAAMNSGKTATVNKMIHNNET